MLGTTLQGVKRGRVPGAIVADRAPMDVFLVPVGEDRYELYCEEPDEVVTVEDEPPRGVVRRLVHRFKEMLAEAERERRRGPAAAEPSSGFAARVKARSLRWVAE